MTRVRGFKELSRKLEALADQFESRAGGPGRDPNTGKFQSAKPRIKKGIDRAMDDRVVPDARSGARPHVPDGHHRQIYHDSEGWKGDIYRHYMYSTSDLVKYHEFGTSTKAQDRSKATINEPGGYRIDPDGKPVAIPADQWTGPDFMVYTDGDGPDAVFFDYVVHPGVSSKRFMQRALNTNVITIEERVADELDDIDLEL